MMVQTRKRVMVLWILAALAGSGLGRAEPSVLVSPVPLAPLPGAAPSERLLKLTAAQRAMELGFPAIAVEQYQRLLEDTALDPAVRNRVVIDLTTALLAEDRTNDAEKTLAKFTPPPSAAYHLRQGLIAARGRRYDQARGELDAAKLDDLSPEDRPWWHYLRGVVADAAHQPSAAFYQQAIDTAAGISSLQQAHFYLLQIQAQLTVGEVSDANANELKQRLATAQGRLLYTAVRAYATALSRQGHRQEATALLARHIALLPVEEHAFRDEWELMLGVIWGAGDGPGRAALDTLLGSGADREKQRAALQMLADASRDKARRDDFRRRLNDLIGATTPHPLLEDLLLFRAEAALADKTDDGYRQAETDANRLLTQFPGSQLKARALGVLTSVAWEGGKYRNAASQAVKARAELPPGETHARFGVLVAEAYYRAEDFRNAADAYVAALNEVPAGVVPGDLMFQAVQAEIKAAVANPAVAERLKPAEALLDRLAADPHMDPKNRWQAEWNLSRALQADGQTSEAYGRVNRLLDTAVGAVQPKELRARLAWLQARLAFEMGEADRTLSLATALLNSGPDLDRRVASTTLLLEAEADFSFDTADRAAEAAKILAKLRTDFPKTDAAAYSYIVQADVYARQNDLVKAETLLKELTDNKDFSGNAYIPFAIYQTALYEEQRGKYDEAYKVLQGLVESPLYRSSDLVFYAKLKQGNLLRQLNQFPQALQTFDEILQDFQGRGDIQREDIFSVQLAKADCSAFLAATDASRRENANTLYESLLDAEAARPDLRIEAGYKYGLALVQRGETARALEIWGRVISFVTEDAKAAALGQSGRYWVARTLLDLGDLFEKQSKLEQARQAYDLILRKGLPGAESARQHLARFQPAGAAEEKS